MMSRTHPSRAASAGPTDAAIPVLYIAGLHRSGTTLLGLLLARALQGEFVGEMEILWQRGVIEDRLCGCGAAFSACPFWTRVGADAFGGWSPEHAARMITLKKRIARRRYIPRLLRGVGSGEWGRELREYAEGTSRLYRAAFAAAGERMLIDSSKTPTHAALLAPFEDIDLRVVHVVRDSRGVAFSKTKTQALLDKPGAMHERFPPVRTGMDWLRDNLLIERVRAGTRTGSLLRYEDLAAEPAATVARILRDLNLSSPALPEAPIARATHSVAGNPLRFSGGERPVRIDDEWRGKMRRRDRLTVGALTWPLLIRYGFIRSR